MRRFLRLLPLVALLPSSTAAAFSQFQSEIPNGRAGSCLTCHTSAAGGRGWNAFGDTLFTENGGTVENPGSVDAFDVGFLWWNAAICGADSDGDGQTNGQELGDPDCAWTTGDDEARSGDISRPGDAASTSPDPDGTDAGAEGEGEGEGEEPAGGCASTSTSGATGLALVGLLPALALLRRRR